MSLKAVPLEILTQILHDCCYPCDSRRELRQFIALRQVSRHFDHLVSRVALPAVGQYALLRGGGPLKRAGLEWMLTTKIRISLTKQIGVFAFIRDSALFLKQNKIIRAEYEDTFLDAVCRTIVAAHDAKLIIRYLIQSETDLIEDGGEYSNSGLRSLNDYQSRLGSEPWTSKASDPEQFYGALQIASSSGSLSAVESLLKKGAEINYMHPLFGTAMRGAIFLDYLRLVQRLIHHGANLSVSLSANPIHAKPPIIYATEVGRKEITEFLAAVPGINTNAKSPRRGETALLRATRRNWIDAVRVLLANPDTDPNPVTCLNENPLEVAIRKGHEDIVRLFLARDDLRPNFGADKHCPMWQAARHGRDWAVSLLLDRYGIDPNMSLDGRMTALGIAAYIGDESVTRVLLKRVNIDPNHQAVEEGQTPLYYAAANNEPSVVRALLEHERVNPKVTAWGVLPLEAAVNNLNVDCARLILRHMDATDKDLEGAVVLAACFRSVEMVRIFLEDAEIRSCLSSALSQALFQAARSGSTDVVREILKYDDIDPNRTYATAYSLRDTALLAAIQGHHRSVARLFLAHPNLDINHVGFEGTVLGLLADRGDNDLIKEVLKNPKLDVNVRAQSYEDDMIVYRQHPDEPYGRFTPQYGTRPTKTDTPLLRAAAKGYFTSLRLIVEDPRTDVLATSLHQRTALWWAVYWNSEGIVRRLLEADNTAVNIQDVEGWSPLHLAVNLSRPDSIVGLLLKQDIIDPNLKTEAGWTALHLAMLCCSPKTVGDLLNHPKIDTKVRLEDGRTALEVHAPGECDCKGLFQTRDDGVTTFESQ